MEPIILREPETASRYILEGLWLQRVVRPTAANIRPALEWAMEIASSGSVLPPIGFVGDLGHIAFGTDREGRSAHEAIHFLGLPGGLTRTYEDHVLGKVYADWSFERASDAMRRYTPGRDRARGLAYVIRQMRERGKFTGVELSPAVIRGLLEISPEDVLRRGWDLLQQSVGPHRLLIELYESITAAARRMPDLLALEDVIALEQRTALADMGQYVAHRQVLQIANRLEAALPRQRGRPLLNRREVLTRVMDEDTYPVGGFSSISTKGSIESLLHSQLAYMETDKALQPDLFDIKYVRDELYYYSRDENQFLRRRRSFLFVLFPDLVAARFKDADLPCQRIILLIALLLVAIRRLSDWLSTDSLKFEFLLVSGEEKILEQEGNLLAMLFRAEIENRTVSIEYISEKEVKARCSERARRSLCQCLSAGVNPQLWRDENGAVVTGLAVKGPRPVVQMTSGGALSLEGEDPQEVWVAALERLLQCWV